MPQAALNSLRKSTFHEGAVPGGDATACQQAFAPPILTRVDENCAPAGSSALFEGSSAPVHRGERATYCSALPPRVSVIFESGGLIP